MSLEIKTLDLADELIRQAKERDEELSFKDALIIATKIEKNDTLDLLISRIQEFDSTFAKAFNLENTDSSVFASIASSMDRIATVSEIE